MENTELVQTWIPKEHKEFLEKKCKETDRKMASYLRMLISSHVSAEQKQPSAPNLAGVQNGN